MQNKLNQEFLISLKKFIDSLNSVTAIYTDQIIQDHFSLVESIRNNFSTLDETVSYKVNPDIYLELVYNFHKTNISLIKKKNDSPLQDPFFCELQHKLQEQKIRFLNELSGTLSESLNMDYLNKREQGTGFQKFIGQIEKLYFKQRIQKNNFYNVFRRVVGKKNKEFTFPLRKISLDKFIEKHVFPLYLEYITTIFCEIRRAFTDTHIQFFNTERKIIESSFVFEKELPSFSVTQNILITTESSLNLFFESIESYLISAIEQSGTWLSSSFIQNIPVSIKKAQKNFEKEQELWQYTFFAFFDDWRFREYLFLYVNQILEAKLTLERLIIKKVENTLVYEVDELIKYTESLIEDLPNPEKVNKEFIRSYLKTQLYKLKKVTINQKDEKEKSARNLFDDIPNLLQKFELDTLKLLDEMPSKIALVKHPDYLDGITRTNLNYFSPKELIEFDILPEFFGKNKVIKSQLIIQLQTIVNQFKDYDQVLDFYLDTSISLTEKEEVSEDEIIQVFKGGLVRLLKINQHVKNHLSQLLNETFAELTQNSGSLIEKLKKLDDNDSILNIQVKILHSRTKAISIKNGRQLLAMASNLFKIGKEFFYTQKGKLHVAYYKLRQKLRINAPVVSVSSEISNFLSEIERWIHELPVIYQHLFKIVPVKELNLFLSRNVELDQLAVAYNDFVKGNYAATLIIGENGSGKSSLVNYYAQKLKSNYKVVNFFVSDFYLNIDDFYRFFNELFPHAGAINSDEDISNYLDKLTEPKIVILDGLERFFYRKIHGFDFMQKFLSLVLNSSRKLFWICTIGQVSADYLQKTMQLYEYFDYKIFINTLTKEQLKEIVLKRNMLSGYQICYIDSKNEENLKRNANEKTPLIKQVKQKELEDEFFAALHKFADSNISLSLFFWLQSIESFKEETIYIRNFSLPDFSFLENLSPIKTYALLNVVLHGKISSELFASIANISYDQSCHILSILKEDSILLHQNNCYKLNGFLYRHVLRILKNRNLIH